jgi:hypothetical protein
MTDDEMNMIIQEITLNVPKEESTLIRDAEASEAWDVLTEQINAIKAEGREVEIPFELPTVDVVEDSLIVEAVE